MVKFTSAANDFAGKILYFFILAAVLFTQTLEQWNNLLKTKVLIIIISVFRSKTRSTRLISAKVDTHEETVLCAHYIINMNPKLRQDFGHVDCNFSQ